MFLRMFGLLMAMISQAVAQEVVPGQMVGPVVRPSVGLPVEAQLVLPNGSVQPLAPRAILMQEGSEPLTVRFSVSAPENSVVSWMLNGPNNNGVSQEFGSTTSVDVPLAQAGSYTMAVAVQPGPSLPAMQGLRHIGVTWNPPFLGSVPSALLVAQNSVIVGILDTGVNYNHPDLQGRIAYNETDAAIDGEDNDENHYADDFLGWDFVNNDRWPADDTGHGTLIAGIVAQEPSVRLLPLKVTSALHTTEGPQLVAGIRYGIARGARILVMSFGSFNALFRDQIMPALEEAQRAGVLLVVASGNQNTNIDERPRYPGSLDLPHLITVGAVNLLGQRSMFSNYGPRSVLVSAYGGDLSDEDQGPVGPSHLAQGVPGTQRHVGTSFAAPVAAALAARFFSEHPGATASDAKAHLIRLAAENQGILKFNPRSL